MQRKSVKIGDRITMKCGYSEAACFLGIAGTTISLEVVNGGTGDRPAPMAQIVRDDNSNFSFPVHCGEVGIYGSNDNLYVLED